MLAAAAAWGQPYNYTVWISSVTWTGQYDNDVPDEEYGLAGTDCINVVANNSGTVTFTSSDLVARLANGVSAPSLPNNLNFTFAGIENDNDTDNTLCTNDGDDPICTVNFGPIDLNSYGEGTFTVTQSCVDNIGTTGTLSVTISIFIDNLLPISLLTFDARPGEQGITLEWSTANEEDNDYMAVERSADADHFIEIGRVQGAGTTKEIQRYSFVDQLPLRGANYYRLRQVDYDGTTEYHKVIYVDFAGRPGSQSLLAAPNPAREKLRVSWNPADNQAAVLRLFNPSGQLMGTYQVAADRGTYELPLNQLPIGLYLLQLTQGTLTETLRFVKE